MSETSPSAVLAPVPHRVRRGRRGLTWATFLLPAFAVAGVLGVAWAAGVGDSCGGPLPGCGNVRNAGNLPATVQSTNLTASDGGYLTSVVAPGERAVLWGAQNEVWVEAEQCLIADGGPFWDARTITDRSAEPAGRWYRVDDWGARLHLFDGVCAERS